MYRQMTAALTKENHTLKRVMTDPRVFSGIGNALDNILTGHLGNDTLSGLAGLDTLYGGAAYMPMADGARYEVWITQSGLIARPTNSQARLGANAIST